MFDKKQRLLIAYYIEYQKDKSNYVNVTPEALAIEPEIFEECRSKLEKEELIKYRFGKNLESVDYEPTLRGIEYIERLFKIYNSLSNVVKLEYIGYEAQQVKIEALVTYVKKAIVEIDSRYEEYFKDHVFTRHDDYPVL